MVDYQSGLGYGNYARSSTVRAGRSDWLEGWLAGEMPDSALMEQIGFQPHQFYAVVVYRLSVAPEPNTPFVAMLQAEASKRRLSGPVLTYQDAAVLFHPVEDPQQTQRLKRLTEEIRERLAARSPEGDVCCGVGRPARDMNDLRQSFREAHDAATLCVGLKTGSRSTFFGDFSLYQLLLSLKNPEELGRFCNNWLSALIEYDEQQHSDLLITLRVYFDHNGNTARTAAKLNIHRNTLAYRLNRIAEITRLDLEDSDVRLNLQLALKAQQVLKAELIQ